MTLFDSPSRPRVLIFRNELLPPSETFILAQARALRGFNPLFAGVHPAARTLELGTTPVFVAPKATLAGKLARRLFWATSIAPRFYQQLRMLEPSLIHAHFAIDGAAALPIAAELNIPLVVTLHGYDVSASDKALAASPEGRVYLRRREQLWATATTFLCISEFIRSQAIARGFPASKLRLHYTGSDLELFRNAANPRDPNMILFVGRLVEKKGCRHLLDALTRMRRLHPAAHLVLIGSGPLEGELRQRAAEADLPCEFLGTQPATVIKDYLSRATVFCAPSVRAASGDSEGLGMVFIEALAMGTPVVSFRHGGIPEVVSDGRTGLLAPEGDSATLALHLQTLLTDGKLWGEFSARARQEATLRFDVVRQTATLEDIYRQAIAG